MVFAPRKEDPLYDVLYPVVSGLGMTLVELIVSRHKGSVQVRATVSKKGIVGVADCSRVHRAVVPRLELAYPDQELYVEIASPGIDRNIKDASEFSYYIGRGVRCYRTDISDWTAGILERADDRGILLRGKDGSVDLAYEMIAKARLDYSQEVED